MRVTWQLGVGCHALLLIGAGVLAAQPRPRRIDYKVACPTCRVELTPVATLGNRSDPAGIGDNPVLARDRQGRFFALSDNFQVLVYDARGKFLQAVGRRGDGPGEFNARGPLARINDVAIGRGDSLFVFHPPLISVFSPRLAFVRTITMQQPLGNLGSIHPLADGSWIIGAGIRRPPHTGRIVHIMNDDGTIRRSLGPEQVPTADRPLLAVWRFTLSPDQRTAWFGPQGHEYAFDPWRIDDVQVGPFVVEGAPYLPEPSYETRRGRGARPLRVAVGGGVVQLMGIDTLGQLWMSGRPPQPDSVTRYLEVVDPRTGAVRSSQKVPASMWPMRMLRTGDLAYTFTVTEDGFVSITVWSYRFVNRP